MQKLQKKPQEESKLAEDDYAQDGKSKFSVGKVAKFCKQGKFAERIGAGAPIYLAAVLEYLTAEIVELAEHQLKADNQKKTQKKQRITPRHIMLAIRNDAELTKLFSDANFCGAGCLPTVQKPANQKKAKKAVEESDSLTEEEF